MYCILQGFLLVGVSDRRRYLQRSILRVQKTAQKWFQNGSKTGPKMGPGRPPEAPQRPHRGLARSCALLHKAFFCGWFWLCCCLCFLVLVLVVCVCVVVIRSFVGVVCLYVCLFFRCVFCFLLLCFCFMPSSSRCSKTALQILGATSKRHATCSRMSPSGLVEMLIRLECVGSAPVVMVPL